MLTVCRGQFSGMECSNISRKSLVICMGTFLLLMIYLLLYGDCSETLNSAQVRTSWQATQLYLKRRLALTGSHTLSVSYLLTYRLWRIHQMISLTREPTPELRKTKNNYNMYNEHDYSNSHGSHQPSRHYTSQRSSDFDVHYQRREDGNFEEPTCWHQAFGREKDPNKYE